MRLNQWIIPDGDVSPLLLVDIVLDRYAKAHGLHLSIEGRSVLHDLLLVIAEDYQETIDDQDAIADENHKKLEEATDTVESLQEDNSDLHRKIETLEKELEVARRTIAVIQAGQANALMWKDAEIPDSWDKVTKET